MSSVRLLIIGLDGATWDVLNPLIQENKLPNIETLIKEGVTSDLESVFPPLTGPTWISMATGKNPGKTGVFDFLNQFDEKLRVEVINSRHFIENGTYWDYLSNNGYRIGILNHPMLFPPYPINGFMVSGLGASEKDKITYPQEMKKELDKATQSYELMLSWRDSKYKNDKTLFLNDLKRLLLKKTKAAEYCLKNYSPDLFLIIFQESDFLLHRMWKDWEERESEFHEGFIEIWQLLDSAIGKLKAQVDNKVTTLIISDHGFGPLKNNFLVNKWLHQEGFLKRKMGTPNRIKNSIRKYLKSFKKPIKFISPSFYGKIRSQLKTSLGDELHDLIDVNNSKAFATGYTSTEHGAIYINKKIKGYESVRKEIIKKMKDFSALKGFNINIFRKEDVYWGEKTQFAPDVLFAIDDHMCNIQPNKFDGDIYSESIPIENKTGSHRNRGIFICSGSNIKKNKKISIVKTFDIAPTILYLFGFKHPESMDGAILKHIFKEFPYKDEELKQLKETESLKTHEKIQKITKEEESEIQERLKHLGYLDK